MKTIALKFLFTVSIWKFILYSNHSLVLILFLTILYKFSLFIPRDSCSNIWRQNPNCSLTGLFSDCETWGPFFLSWAISKYLVQQDYFTWTRILVCNYNIYGRNDRLLPSLALKTGRMQWTRKDIWADYLHT